MYEWHALLVTFVLLWWDTTAKGTYREVYLVLVEASESSLQQSCKRDTDRHIFKTKLESVINRDWAIPLKNLLALKLKVPEFLKSVPCWSGVWAVYLPKSEEQKTIGGHLQLGSPEQVPYALEMCLLTARRPIESRYQGGASKYWLCSWKGLLFEEAVQCQSWAGI